MKFCKNNLNSRCRAKFKINHCVTVAIMNNVFQISHQMSTNEVSHQASGE